MLDAYKKEGVYDEYYEQLEYSAFYHQVLTSCARVNLADWKSDVQDRLYADYLEKFPSYLQNRYLRSMSKKYKLLHFFIRHKMKLCLHIVMKANNLIKGK